MKDPDLDGHGLTFPFVSKAWRRLTRGCMLYHCFHKCKQCRSRDCFTSMMATNGDTIKWFDSKQGLGLRSSHRSAFLPGSFPLRPCYCLFFVCQADSVSLSALSLCSLSPEASLSPLPFVCKMTVQMYSFTIPTSSHHRDILIKEGASKITIAAHSVRSHVLAIVFMIDQTSTGSLREQSLRSGSNRM